MADNSPNPSKLKLRPPATPGAEDRMPTNRELLDDLSPYGANRRRAEREIPTVSRRTRDFLLIAGIGSAVIIGAAVKLTANSDGMNIAKLACTGVALFCGLLWYIFYGVMNRY